MALLPGLLAFFVGTALSVKSFGNIVSFVAGIAFARVLLRGREGAPV